MCKCMVTYNMYFACFKLEDRRFLHTGYASILELLHRRLLLPYIMLNRTQPKRCASKFLLMSQVWGRLLRCHNTTHTHTHTRTHTHTHTYTRAQTRTQVGKITAGQDGCRGKTAGQNGAGAAGQVDSRCVYESLYIA